jgi:hypothetical protein
LLGLPTVPLNFHARDACGPDGVDRNATPNVSSD